MLENIKLIQERISDNSQIIDIIHKGNNIFFMGFSYQPDNLVVLDIPNCFSQGARIYGTALSLYPQEIDRIYNNLLKKDYSGSRIKLEDGNCSILLRKYFQ